MPRKNTGTEIRGIRKWIITFVLMKENFIYNDTFVFLHSDDNKPNTYFAITCSSRNEITFVMEVRAGIYMLV